MLANLVLKPKSFEGDSNLLQRFVDKLEGSTMAKRIKKIKDIFQRFNLNIPNEISNANLQANLNIIF